MQINLFIKCKVEHRLKVKLPSVQIYQMIPAGIDRQLIVIAYQL